MFVIKTKNKEYTGVLAGITIVNGVGKTDTLSDSDKAWLERYGHTVEEEKAIEKAEKIAKEEKAEKTGKRG